MNKKLGSKLGKFIVFMVPFYLQFWKCTSNNGRCKKLERYYDSSGTDEFKQTACKIHCSRKGGFNKIAS